VGDVANAITVDASGNAYVTGNTAGDFHGAPFPKVNPIQPIANVSLDYAFITKFDTNGNMVYSSPLGGSTGFNSGAGIAVDKHANIYVTGTTAATDFPTSKPFQASLRGNSDVL
jgi:hypothetical protein